MFNVKHHTKILVAYNIDQYYVHKKEKEMLYTTLQVHCKIGFYMKTQMYG